VAYLRRNAQGNLLLLDMATMIGDAPGGREVAPQLLSARAGGEVCGVAALRPSLALDSEMEAETLAVLLPYIEVIPTGLMKSPTEIVSALWKSLRERGRHALIDRIEIAYELRKCEVRGPGLPAGAHTRPAQIGDLDELVAAARASLLEEKRPDAGDGDPAGFRRWVEGRLARARVVEWQGRVAFVGYADVRRADGWLVQGVYTFPKYRRSGLAAAGMAAIAAEAFDTGADHVQLAVVDGNRPAIGLYEGLGFRPFGELRTILFY
jgi:predicted GNAT family acetyltransferase